MIKFSASPKNVLDIGCGTGTWLFDAAEEFSKAELVGMDYHAIYPKLETLRMVCADDPVLVRRYKRCKFIKGDFLKPLPFDDSAFDYVHVKQIAVCLCFVFVPL